MAAWTSREAVVAWLKLTQLDPATEAQVALCVQAANSLTGRYVEAVDGEELSGDGRLGATMLAARLHRRRNSPEGVQLTTDGALYVARTDPDVARLLRIDAFNVPQVG